jgi:hypothetical protein
VRPCTAGGCGGMTGSKKAHSSSLISRGGEDTEDMRGTLRRTVRTGQSLKTYLCNVF